jgi:hypothetical protein
MPSYPNGRESSVKPGIKTKCTGRMPERILLFCVASGTKWERAGISGVTVTATMVPGDGPQRRSAFDVLLAKGASGFKDLVEPMPPGRAATMS